MNTRALRYQLRFGPLFEFGQFVERADECVSARFTETEPQSMTRNMEFRP